MPHQDEVRSLRNRQTPLERSQVQLRRQGFLPADQITDFRQSLPQRSVTPVDTPQVVRKLTGTDAIPEPGTPAERLSEGTLQAANADQKWNLE